MATNTLYPLIKPLLFKFDAEIAHELTLKGLFALHKTGLGAVLTQTIPDNPVDVMGLNFKNPVGLAAGLDKNGDYIDALADLGFGFIEIGTVTPRPQPGNPKPRLFRLPEHEAIINRMGFNNYGIDHLLNQVKSSHYKGVLGINIGKNFDTPIENAVADYLIGLRKAYVAASYITINISSPNTKNLRQLQQVDESRRLLSALKTEQQKLQQEYGKYTPLVVKIAPDLLAEELTQFALLLLEFEFDGIIATNTTIARNLIAGHAFAEQQGGLSGKPLQAQSTLAIRTLAQALQGKIPIIGVGGITTGADAQEKIAAGANLIQLYSGLIYKGPQLIADVANALR